MNHKSSYSSFYGLYGPFEANPWKEDSDSEKEEEEEEIDSSSLKLLLLIIQCNIILPSLPILSSLYNIVSWIFGNFLTSVLVLPLSVLISSAIITNVPPEFLGNLLVSLGILSFFYSLPIFFKIYHLLVESTIILSIIFWILLSFLAFTVFSIAIYNWIRLCWTISSSVVVPLHKSKSMPDLNYGKLKEKSLRSTKSHYFQASRNWSARFQK